MTKTYYDYRKQYYASINGRIGNLSILSKSRLVKKDELEQLHKVINELRRLSSMIKNNGV